MSDEEEILFDDIYEVASHCQHSYFILTINTFIVAIVFIIIFGNTNKVNVLTTSKHNIVIINQRIYDTNECVGVGGDDGDDDGDDDEAFQSTHDPDRPNYITACSDVPI